MNACCGHGETKAAYIQFDNDDYKNNPNKVRLSGENAVNYIEHFKTN